MARKAKDTVASKTKKIKEPKQQCYADRLEGIKQQATLLIEDELIPVIDEFFEVAPEYNALRWHHAIYEDACGSEFTVTHPQAQFKPQPLPDGFSSEDGDEQFIQEFYDTHELAKLATPDVFNAMTNVFSKADLIGEVIRLAYGDNLIVTVTRDEMIFNQEENNEYC